MKTINVTFADDEHAALTEEKKKVPWRMFIVRKCLPVEKRKKLKSFIVAGAVDNE